MIQRTLLIIVFSSLIGACSFQSGQTWSDYTLSPGVQRQQAGERIPITLQVAIVEAPSWLNSRNMYYRLDYLNPDRILSYSESRWLASPPTMLANLLVGHLSHAGICRSVLGPGASVYPDDTLYVHLIEFQQVFKTRQRSQGVLSARVSLVDDHQDTVVAQIPLHFEVSASTANADGGATALNKASDKLVHAVQAWLVHVLTDQASGNGRRD